MQDAPFASELDKYLQQKFDDHRSFTIAMFVLGTVLGPSLWLWDYVTDPQGAQQTLGLRLGFLLFGVFPLAFRFSPHRQLLTWSVMGAMLGGEVLFFLIIQRLHDGMVYGPGGFLIFIYSPMLLFCGFSLRLNLLYIVLASALPQGLAVLGDVQDFQHRHYAILIWPTTAMMSLALLAYERNYWHRYQSQAALVQASNTDPMTGLDNRRHFMPLLRQELQRVRRTGRSAALLMLDLDHFKRVNDSHGHPTGDLVICKFADICRKASRQIDTVARMGGEEFAILMPYTGIQEACALAERIRSMAEDTAMSALDNGESFYFTVSIGVAEMDTRNESEEVVIAQADEALFAAKSAGRNCIQAHVSARMTP